MRLLLCFLFLATVIALEAQDINGVWRGKLTQDPGGCYPEYFIELQIKQNASGISGFTYVYYDPSKYVKLNFTGNLNTTTKRMVINENKVVDYKIPKDCFPCIKTYDLVLSYQDNEDVLSGSWKAIERGPRVSCPPGHIF